MTVAALLVALVGAEVALRRLDLPERQQVGWRSFYQSYAPLAQANQLGFRGRPIEYADGDTVVVLVGDSQVEARACAYDWMPESRLEHHLSALRDTPVRVFSVGVSGYGTDQELLALRDYFERGFRADHVVLWLTLNNDVKDNTWPTFMPIDGRPKPTFWLADGELRGPHLPPGPVPPPRLRTLALLQSGAKGSVDVRWAAERLPPAYASLEDPGEGARGEWLELQAEGLLNPRTLAMEKNDRALLLEPRSARTAYGVRLTHRLLLAVEEEAARHGASFSLFAVDRGDRTDEIDGVYEVAGRYYRASSRRFWASVEEVTSGLDFVLLPVREPLWRVGPRDHHLNQHATDGVMRELALNLVGLL